MLNKKIEFLIEDLPPLPEIISILIIELNAEDPDFSSIEKLISKDPFFTTKLLNISNSAMFNLFRRVNSINEALQFIGFRRLLNLVLASGLSKDFNYVKDLDLFSFWQYSINVSNLCQTFAIKAGENKDIASTIGLIHGVGELILASKLALQLEDINKESETFSLNRTIRERNTLGFCYLDVSYEFIKKNKFSSLIINVIKNQADLSFNPNHWEKYDKLSLIIYLSIWRVRYRNENPISDVVIVPETELKITKYLELTEEDIVNPNIIFWASKEDVVLII